MLSQNQARRALLVTALLFSTGGAVIKATPLSGVEIAGLRSGLGALILLLVFRPARSQWTRGALLVGACQGATLLLFALANKLTSATGGIFLQYTAPIYVLAFGPWLLNESVTRRDWTSVGLLAIGASFFFWGNESAQATATAPALGNLLGLASGITWAATLVGLRRLARAPGGNSTAAGPAVIAGNALVFLICLPWLDPGAWSEMTTTTLLKISWLGLFQIGVAYILLESAVRSLRALETSLILLIEPVLAVSLAYLFLGERQSVPSLIGATIILATTLKNTLSQGVSTRSSTN